MQRVGSTWHHLVRIATSFIIQRYPCFQKDLDTPQKRKSVCLSGHDFSFRCDSTFFEDHESPSIRWHIMQLILLRLANAFMLEVWLHPARKISHKTFPKRTGHFRRKKTFKQHGSCRELFENTSTWTPPQYFQTKRQTKCVNVLLLETKKSRITWFFSPSPQKKHQKNEFFSIIQQNEWYHLHLQPPKLRCFGRPSACFGARWIQPFDCQRIKP